jgi:hypothetical protein
MATRCVRIMAQRRHRLAPFFIAGEALERCVDEASSGKSKTCCPVGVRRHFDEYWVLVRREPEFVASVRAYGVMGHELVGNLFCERGTAAVALLSMRMTRASQVRI